MSDATMPVEVVSAERHVLSAEITEIYARGVEGEIGILPGHQPALVALDIGPVRLTRADGSVEKIAVHHGVLFVGVDGKVIVLADIAEPASDIDVARAQRRKRIIEERLTHTTDPALRRSLRKQQLRVEMGGD
ncbi:MAG: ATP synthase F1 subunit epsilon [Actinomycetota bacterium]